MRPLIWTWTDLKINTFLLLIYYSFELARMPRQENHAIAKMTARCAQYVSALKTVGLCKRKISRRWRKNLHITIITILRWNYFRSIPSNVITAPSDLNVTDGQTLSDRRTLWHHRAVKIRRQIIADIIDITDISSQRFRYMAHHYSPFIRPAYGSPYASQLTSLISAVLSTGLQCARLPECPTSYK